MLVLGNSIRIFDPQLEEKIPKSEDSASFYTWLLLAWCIRQSDHAKVKENDDLCDTFNKLHGRGLPIFQALDLTFIPLGLLEFGIDFQKYLEFPIRQHGPANS